MADNALIINITAKADKALKELDDLTGRLKKLENEVKTSSKSTAQMKKSFDSLGKRANALAKSLVGVFGAVASYQGAKQYVAMLGKVEEGFIGVAKTTGLAGKELDRLKNKIYGLSTTMAGVSVEQLQNIAETAGQLGISGADNIEEFTRVVAEMGVATDLSAEQAATAFARLGNVLGEPVKQYERMGSVINELSNNTTALASDIVDISNRMAGMGKTFGLSTQDIFGFAAALKDVGLENEVAGSSFSTLLGQMLKATDKFAKFMGMSFEQLSTQIRTKPTEAIKAFLAQLSKLDAQQQVGALKDLGLSGLRVSEAVLKLSGNMQKLNADLAVARGEWQRNTSLQKEYETASSSLNAQFQRTKNTLLVLGVKIGKELLPNIKKVNAEFQQWVKTLDPKKIDRFSKSLGEAFGALGKLAKLIQQINDVLMPDFLSNMTNMESNTLFGAFAEGWDKLLGLVSAGGDAIGATFEDYKEKAQEAADATETLQAKVSQFTSGSQKEFAGLVEGVKEQIDVNQKLIDEYGKYSFAKDYVAQLYQENEKLLKLYGELSKKRPFAPVAQDAATAKNAIDKTGEALENIRNAPPVKTKIGVDTGDVETAKSKIEAMTRELTLNGVTLKVNADTTPADFGIKRFETKVDGKIITITPNVEYEKAEKQIDQLKRGAEVKPIKQKVEADTKPAKIEIQKLEKPKNTKLHVVPDASKALQTVSELQKPIITQQYIYQHIIPAAANGGLIERPKPKRFSVGGQVPGYDPLGSDDVPALLTRGEFVINAKAVRFYGIDKISALNRMMLPRDAILGPKLPVVSSSGGRYSDGGVVDEGVAAKEVNINLSFSDSESLTVSADEKTAELLEMYLRKHL